MSKLTATPAATARKGAATRKPATARTLATVVRLITRRDYYRAAVADARKRAADAVAYVKRSQSLANVARHAARPSVIGTAALTAAATVAGATLADGATVALTAAQTTALAAPAANGTPRYPSLAPLAGHAASITVTAAADGTLRGTVTAPAALAVLAGAESTLASARKTADRDVAAVLALVGKHTAAADAVKSALAALTVAERATVRATVADAQTGV